MNKEQQGVKLYTSKEVALLINRSIKTVTAQAPKYATVKLGDRWFWADSDIAMYRQKMRKVYRHKKETENA